MPADMARPFDVFISYRHLDPDATWVRQVLVAHLRAAGLQVLLDSDGFTPGAHVVSEIERGVETSRFTLAVLTPRYLTSGFTTFETVLTEHLGLERAESRLLLVVREPCQAPLRLRARVSLDMTHDEALGEQLDRLIAVLGR